MLRDTINPEIHETSKKKDFIKVRPATILFFRNVFQDISN